MRDLIEQTFRDEAFSLSGPAQIGGMWRMLCEATQAKGMAHWKLEHSQVQSDGRTGSAHWEAHYLFSATGRLVHNRIDASFRFDERGLILVKGAVPGHDGTFVEIRDAVKKALPESAPKAGSFRATEKLTAGGEG